MAMVHPSQSSQRAHHSAEQQEESDDDSEDESLTLEQLGAKRRATNAKLSATRSPSRVTRKAKLGTVPCKFKTAEDEQEFAGTTTLHSLVKTKPTGAPGERMAYPDNLMEPVTERVARRNDATPLPKTEGDWQWTAPYVIVGRDNTCSAENAAIEIWPESEVISAECSFHAGPSHWAAKHLEQFNCLPNKKKDMRQVMQTDFNRYCAVPYHHLADYAKTLMIELWMNPNGRNEAKVAAQWMKTYANSRLTHVESSIITALRGGIPTTSNCIESANRVDKLSNDFKKSSPTDLPRVVADMLEGQSCCDIDWNRAMKKPVNSAKFIKLCNEVLLAKKAVKKDGDPLPAPCCLTVRFSIPPNKTHGIPPKSFLVPSYSTLEKVLEELSRRKLEYNVKNVHSLLKSEWLPTYLNCVRKPERVLLNKQPQERFHLFMDWIGAFRCLRPLNANVAPKETRSVFNMLLANSYKLITWEDLLSRGNDGLVQCDCKNYMHYCWCYHVATCARDRGIVLEWPATLDVTRHFHLNKGGSYYARKGGALSFD